MNPTTILEALILKRAEAQLAAEWQAVETQLTAALKTARLNQLVSTEDVGYDQTFFHGLEVRNAAEQIQPMTRGFLRLHLAAIVLYARRSHRKERLPQLIAAATADVETRLNQLATVGTDSTRSPIRDAVESVPTMSVNSPAQTGKTTRESAGAPAAPVRG